MFDESKKSLTRANKSIARRAEGGRQPPSLGLRRAKEDGGRKTEGGTGNGGTKGRRDGRRRTEDRGRGTEGGGLPLVVVAELHGESASAL